MGANVGGEDRTKVLEWAYKKGLYSGLPTTEAKRKIDERFNPKSAQSTQGPSGGKDKENVVDYNELLKR